MKIQSQRAKEIEAFLGQNPNVVVNWPIEIAGEKKILPVFRFPLNILRYNKKNGRLFMEVKEWEGKNKRALDTCHPKDAKIVKDMLLNLDITKTEVLKEDIRKKGQMEPGVITHDGFVINGNRRMAILEELHKEEPTGKWDCFEAVRLPEEIQEKDLWKIEAGLQLSKDKVAEYHPVNELLKIKQGLNSGLTPEEVAAAMYGWTTEEVKEGLKRLELIDSFLIFIRQSDNYGVIKKFGLHEHFIDVQKYLLNPARKRGLSRRELAKHIDCSFALIRTNILLQGKPEKKQTRITHWDIRKLGKIFDDPRAKAAFLEHLGESKKILSVPPKTVIDDFQNAVEELNMKEQRDQPVKLILKAIKALERIDKKSKHFHEQPVKDAMTKISKIVSDINKDLGK